MNLYRLLLPSLFVVSCASLIPVDKAGAYFEKHKESVEDGSWSRTVYSGYYTKPDDEHYGFYKTEVTRCEKEVEKDDSWRAFFLKRPYKKSYDCWEDGDGPISEERRRLEKMYRQESACKAWFYYLKHAYEEQEAKK